jgi:hypothetical protein
MEDVNTEGTLHPFISSPWRTQIHSSARLMVVFDPNRRLSMFMLYRDFAAEFSQVAAPMVALHELIVERGQTKIVVRCETQPLFASLGKSKSISIVEGK